MQVKKLDATPYLLEGEKVELKITATKSNFTLVQTILCYAFWILVLAGDCFLLGMTNTLKESLNNVTTFLMPIIIVLLVLHIVPFAFWLVYILQSRQKGGTKWYAITNKRILTISGNRPVNVTFIDINDVTSFKLNKNSISLALGEENVTLYNIAYPTPIANFLTSIFEGNEENEESIPAPESAGVANSENDEENND